MIYIIYKFNIITNLYFLVSFIYNLNVEIQQCQLIIDSYKAISFNLSPWHQRKFYSSLMNSC